MKIRLPGLVLFLWALVPSASALAGEFPVRVEEKTLPNGLKCFVLPRPGQPAAMCALAVRVGSFAERPGLTGMAHFLEHMMFKGSSRLGTKDPVRDAEVLEEIDAVVAEILALEDAGGKDAGRLAELKRRRDALFKETQGILELNPIFKAYSDAGSTMTNAFTSEDWTVYFSALPPERIEVFFWVEADRFGGPVFRQFHEEKEVVREELRLSENRPGFAFREEFGRVLYGDHPYGHPVLGSHDDLRRMTRRDVRAYFDAWYTPDNMLLLVAGDVEPAEVFALASRYFGPLRPFEGARPRIPVLPARRAGAARVYGHGPGTPSLSVTYRVPPAGSAEEVACEMLASRLGDPEGALRRRLVTETELATSMRAEYEAQRFAGTLQVRADMRRGRAPEEAEAEILAAVQSLIDAPLPEAEVRALARRYRAGILGSVKDEMRMGFLFLSRENVGSWRDIEGLSVPAPPPEPRPAPKAPEGIPESLEKIPAREKPFEVPRAEDAVATLSCGARAVIVSDPYDPVFRIQAVLAGGAAEDPEGREGLCALLAAAADRSGLPGMDRKAIREKLEALVGEANVESGPVSLTVSLNALKEGTEEALGLFRALLLDLALDEEAVRTERERMKSSLADEEARPGHLSRRAWRELLWKGTPRARRATPASVAAVAREDLEKALARLRDPCRCVLAVSSDLPREKVLALLEKTFGGWKAGGAPPPRLEPLSPAPARGLHVMDFPASQGFVQVGAATAPRSAPDFAALRMLQLVLARRIFDRIRSNEGLAYHASADAEEDWEAPVLMGVIFQTKARSVPFGISIAIEELQRIAKEPPAGEEMEQARKKVRAGLRMRLGRGSERAGAFAELLLHPSAGLDWHRRYAAAAAGLSAAEVSGAAAKYLKRENLLILCVGKASEMEAGDGEHPQKLADFGPAAAVAGPAAAAEPVTPEDVVRTLVRKLSQSDVEGMKKHLAAEFRKRLDDPKAAAQLAAQGRMMGQAKTEVGAAKIEGDDAAVRAVFEAKMGEQTMRIEMEFLLKKEDGKWVCAGFKPAKG
ncbi:MAG: insulinase family protein [Planctomycetes bacterium]|nr:insulinase family protein [Planctomycetota bacterium]